MYTVPSYALLFYFQKRIMASTLSHISKILSKMMKSGTFSHRFFEEKNVSAAVAHNKIDIFYVINYNQVIM